MSHWLLDANVLFALAAENHPQLALAWFHAHSREGWATCATTELAFLRLAVNPHLNPYPKSPKATCHVLGKLIAHRHHVYWRDPSNVLRGKAFQDTLDRVVTHSDVTDAYLVALAAHHRGWVATFDEALAGKFHPVARLITWAM